MYRVKPGRACDTAEGGVRDAREPQLRNISVISDGNKPGKPDALKGACPVWERGVGNVSTPKVRDRRVAPGRVLLWYSRQPFWIRDNAPASYFMKICEYLHLVRFLINLKRGESSRQGLKPCKARDHDRERAQPQKRREFPAGVET